MRPEKFYFSFILGHWKQPWGLAQQSNYNTGLGVVEDTFVLDSEEKF